MCYISLESVDNSAFIVIKGMRNKCCATELGPFEIAPSDKHQMTTRDAIEHQEKLKRKNTGR